MRKSVGKNIKKIIAGVVLAGAGAALIIAENGRKTVWGDSLGEGSRESATTGEWTPSRYAYDGDESTYWQAEKGAEESWFEYYTEEERSIRGCIVDCEIAEGSRLSIYYEKEGSWIPLENGSIEGEYRGKKQLNFKDSLYETKRMLVKVSGERAWESLVREITWEIREDNESFMKIQPESYTFNQKEYINLKADRLWNGSIKNTWYEPVWYLPWEITLGKAGTEGIFAPYMGNPPEEGEIIWELDGKYKIETVKAYFSQSYRCIAFEFWDGNGWSGRTVINGNSGSGWSRAECEYEGRTDRIRITFPYGWEMAKYINQVEIWGSGEKKNKERGAVVTEADGSGKIHFSGENLEGKKYRAVAIKNGRVTAEETVKDYQLRKGTHYFELQSKEGADGVVIREERNDGRIRTRDSLDDGFTEEGSEEVETERRIELPGEYEIEKIRLYGEGLENAGIVCNDGYETIELAERHGYYETELKGKKVSSITVTGTEPFKLTEAKVYGSPLEDEDVELEIWTKEEVKGEEDCIIGWMGDSHGNPVIDGEYNPRQMDNVFWMPLKECGKMKKDYREYSVTCSIDGKTGKRNAVVRKEGRAEYDDGKRGYGTDLVTIDVPAGSLYTQSRGIRISGKYGNAEQVEIHINGEKAEKNGKNAYSGYVNLAEGENEITVEAQAEDGRRDVKKIKVYSDTESPEIEILYPNEGEYIASEYVTISADGKKDRNLWWKINDEAWESGEGYIKNKTYRLEDDFYTFSVTAQDRSGNVSETKSVNFCIDVTPPEPCNITIEEPPYNRYNWTNNTTPVIWYSTTDATSGVAWYEYKVDENGSWTVIETETPGEFRLPPLKDGKHRIYVRGRDKAGNACEDDEINSYVACNVDTTAPSEPYNLNAVGGKDFITFSWESANNNPSDAEDFHDFVITRSYEGRVEYIEVKGNALDRNHEKTEIRVYEREFGANKYVDYGRNEAGLQAGDKYKYSIYAIDRAGNTSAASEAEGTAGVSIARVEKGKPTVIEYDNVVLTIPEETLAPSVVRIIVNECQIEDAAVIPENPVLSHIFRVLQVRQKKNADGKVEEFVTEHANLDGYASFDIRYEEPSEEWKEAEIRPYYYDDIFGTWLPEQRAVTDRENRTVHFKVNHFCDFTVQATEESILSPEQMRSGSYSPMASEIGQGAVNVSSEGGDVSTEFTETRLPGRNGLDFVVQRVYSNGNAVKDAKKVTKKDENSREIRLNGDDAWKAGKGWRINVPSLTWNGSEIWVKDFSGAAAGLSQSSGVTEESSSSGTEWKWYGENEKGEKSFITFTSHEYTDLKVELSLSSVAKKWLCFPLGTSYALDGAVLYQKDGSSVNFDSSGRVIKVTDNTGKNTIVFEYSDKGNKVTTSLGNTIYFQKEGENITEIREEKENGRKACYKMDDNGCLIKATDFGGREWTYTYEKHELSNDSTLISVDGKKQENKISRNDSKTTKEVQALKSVSGPGYGTYTVEYAPESFSYKDDFKSGNVNCEYEISYQELKAKKVVQKDRREILYSTSYTAGKETPWQFVPEEATINDGLVTTRIEYAQETKSTYRFSQAPDFMKKMSGVEGIGENEKEKKTVTYSKKITRSAGNKVFETEENEYDTGLMRVKVRKVSRAQSGEKESDGYSERRYEYDANGNVTKELTVIRNGESLSAVRTDRKFKNIKDAMYVPENITVTEYQAMTASAGFTDFSKEKPQDEGKLFSTVTDYGYNAYGQTVSKRVNNDIAGYRYTYNGDSELESETTPEGVKTSYSYEYKDDYYTVTKTLGGKSSVQKLSIWNGKVVSETDRDEYETRYEYDGLNRVTEQVKKTNDTSLSDVKILVSYTDEAENLTSTVTNEKGVKTKNSFDRYGRLIKTVQDTENQKKTTELVYDRYDRVIEMKGPYLETYDGYRTKYEYDDRGRITSVINPEDRTRTTVYDDITGSAVTTDESKRVSRTISDINGNVVETGRKDSSGRFIVNGRTWYSAGGKVVRKEDGRGNTIYVSYNSLGLESSVVMKDAEGKEVSSKTKEYDKDGRLIKETLKVSEKKNVSTEYRYNDDGTVKEKWTEVSEGKIFATKYEYDGRGNILSETSGYTVTEKDEGGRDKAADFAADAFKVRSRTYDYRGNVKTETDEAGNVTSYEYDACGNRTRVTDPREGSEEPEYKDSSYYISMEYDSLNRLVKAWIPKNGAKIDLTKDADIIIKYDGRGHVTERKDPGSVVTVNKYTKSGLLEEQKAGELKTVYGYDASGRKTKETDPNGKLTAYEYDAFGRLERETDPDGTVIYTYNNDDSVESVTDRNGNKTLWEYNGLGQVVSEKVSGLGTVKEMSYEYDMTGRLTKQTDGTGNTIEYSYDALGRIEKEERNYGEKNTQTYEYDAWGNVTFFKDFNGTTFERMYSKQNLLKEETATNGGRRETVSYKYDIAGNVKSVKNDGGTVFYNLDGQGRYISNPYGNILGMKWDKTRMSAEYGYDTANHLESVSYNGEKVSEYAYDGSGRLSGQTGVIDVVNTWTAALLESVQTGEQKEEFLYDAGNRLISLTYTGLASQRWKYGYDHNGNITSKTENGGLVSEYAYDGANQLITANEAGNFERDGGKNLVCFIEEDYDGKESREGVYEVSVNEVSFDRGAQSLVYSLGDTRKISKLELYTTGKKDHRVSNKNTRIYVKGREENSHWVQLKDFNYTADKTNGSLHFELKEAVNAYQVKINTLWNDRDFDWNVVDRGEFRNKPLNLLRVTVLESRNSEVYAYDLSGNRTGGIEYYRNSTGGNTSLRKKDGKWTYEYDANGNRISKKSVNGKESWTYRWDLHNRLIEVIQKDPEDRGTPVHVSYEYDGLNHRISRTGTDGSKTEYAYGRNGAVIVERAGNITRSYIYANGVIAGFVDSDGVTSETRYCVTDHQGSVEKIVDEKGSVLWEGCYTAFGVKGGESINRIEFTGMFTGKDIDPETGLTYHWNRWRSEDGSVWLTQDPARDGTNWYGYCGNNPVMGIDPSGLIAQAIVGAFIGAVTSAATNFAVQTISNVISGQDLKTAVINVDLKSVGSAAIGGAVTGALSGGLSSLKVIGEAVGVYKTANVLLNSGANMIGTAASTVIDNAFHDEDLSNRLGENIAVACIAGVVSGVSAKTGIKEIYTNSNGIRESSILYMDTISTSGLTTMTTIAPNESMKEIGIGFIQEIGSTISQQLEE